jgi:membrane associated rhomboid family serine protease
MSFHYTRPDNFPPVIKNLVILNVIVFAATQFIFANPYLVDESGDPSLLGMLGLWPVTSPYFKPFQLVSHMFTHGGIAHIFFNMFNLWMFGRILENVWGSKKFLSFYLICGLGAAVAYLVEQYLTGGELPAVGASGAVMGVMVAFAYLFPNTELMFMFLPVPIKAKWLITALIAIDLFAGLGGRPTGIAHWAHLGGAAIGFALVFYWNKTNKKTFY